MKNLKKASALAFALSASLMLAACGGDSSDEATDAATDGASESLGTINVFAAASLVDVLPEIDQQLTDEYPDAEFTYNFDGSSGLVDQLAGGARADLLLTANAKTMTDAEDQDLVEPSQSFTSNTLVMVVPSGNPGEVTGLDDGSLDGKKLVVCAEEVPCGAATVELEEVNDLELSPVSEEQSVTDVLGKVTSGEADAGLVYVTDATSAGDAVETIEVPGADDIINDYRIAIVKDAENAEGAQTFLDLILSDDGQSVLESFGFGAP
ncbi:MAG: molybdate ABC transporter substrate-binding protein, partial [Ancrocorticia sp.]